MHRSKFLLAFATAVLVSTATPAAAQIQIQSFQEVSGTANGTTFRGVNPVGAPLLARFQYHFTSGDHHIRQIAAMPLPQQSAVEVTFADENGDDQYGFRVSHEWVDPAGIVQASFHNTCKGQCTTGLLTRPAGDFVFVLEGFRVNFDNGDHHLHTIGVTESGGFLTTTFRDENGDDPFTYDVTYAWVPRARLGVVAQTSGSVHASGVVRPFAFGGEKVIRGFFIANNAIGDGVDNHIRDLGVVANADNFEVDFGDDNPGNSPDWRYLVQYAVVP